MAGNPQKAGNPRAQLTYTSPDDPRLKRQVMTAIEWMTGRRRLERLYTQIKTEAPPPARVWESLLDKLEIDVDYEETALLQTPAEGPVVFLANHPFGVVDGLILGYLISRVRSPFYLLVNEVLCREEMLAPFLLPVDFRETRTALQTNLETRRLALQHLRQGAALGIFPAGGVATAPGGWGRARDLAWKRFVAKLIQQTQATVVPLYVHGQNSRLFQVASQFSQNLRLSLLLHEVRNKMGVTVRVSVGSPLPYEELAWMRDRQVLLDHLRTITFDLAGDDFLKKK